MSNEITKEFEKSFEKNLKKFLTNENERDKLNELSQESKKHKRTLITKQWNTYDSRKFFKNHHSTEWTFYKQ